MKRTISNFIWWIGLILSFTIFFLEVFSIEFTIWAGPFIDFLIFIPIFLLSFIFSLVSIGMNDIKKLRTYIPFTLFILSFFVSYFGISEQIHFLSVKNKLYEIENIANNSGIYKMTDFLRYSKSLNEGYVSGDFEIRTEKELLFNFQNIIKEDSLDTNTILKLRGILEKSDIINLNKDDDFLVLTIDGFIDNEFGYVKTDSKNFKVGSSIPPYGFTVTKLIDLGKGWFFFYSS